MGLFGGFSHRLKDYPLTFIAEYNPDQYDLMLGEVALDHRVQSRLVLAGCLPGVVVTASHQHGDEFGVAFQFAADSTLEPARRAPDNFISSYYLSQEELHLRFGKIGGIQGCSMMWSEVGFSY